MELQKFMKTKWQSFEIINYIPSRKQSIVIECFLLAIDFEQELFKLEPSDKGLYEDSSFWVRIEKCEKPIRKLKKV